MQEFKTEQERFWAGKFGDQYINRNDDLDIIASNTVLFSRILLRTSKIKSVIELGANIGFNLHAIRSLLPTAKFSAVEINKQAVEQLNSHQYIQTYHQSILDFEPDLKCDFVLVKGVLIHINPEELQQVYELIYATASRYICIAEYYNPSPIEISYRGHPRKLFKRDFAGEILDMFSDLRLLDYGFVWHRDPFPQDDITWFLLEKV